MTCAPTNINIATPANFRLVFPKLPQQTSLAANNELILNTHGVILPSLNLNFEEMAWQGTKRKVAQNQLEFEQLQTQFLIDSQFFELAVVI